MKTLDEILAENDALTAENLSLKATVKTLEAAAITRTEAPKGNQQVQPSGDMRAQFQAITDPKERAKFWAANRNEILK